MRELFRRRLIGAALLAIKATLLLLAPCQIARSEDDGLENLIERVQPGVCIIETDGRLSGTGFIVADDIVITNHHVIEGASKISVVFQDRTKTTVRGSLFIDQKIPKGRDIAVLKIDEISPTAKVLELFDDLPEQGVTVIAFGHPEGEEFSVTKGIVSAIYGAGEADLPTGTWIKTDAAISGGNSGGPLVNLAGKVVGMNTYSKPGVQNDAQNLNYAISSLDLGVALKTAKINPLKPIKSDDSKWHKQAVAAIKKQIRDMDDKIYKKAREKISEGKYEVAFSVASPLRVKVGSLVRVHGNITLIQIMNNGALADYFPKGLKGKGIRVYLETKQRGGGADFRAGNNNRDVFGKKERVDFLGIRMPADNYLNFFNGQMAFIPILDHEKYLRESDHESIKEFLTLEDQRREALQKKATEKLAAKKKQKKIDNFIKFYKRQFKNKKGKTLVALPIKVTAKEVSLLRWRDKKEFAINLKDLSRDDRDWLQKGSRADKINKDGKMVSDYLRHTPAKAEQLNR